MVLRRARIIYLKARLLRIMVSKAAFGGRVEPW
jgi:hypothetical protein